MAHLSKIGYLLAFLLFALPIVFFPFTYLAFEMPKVLLLFLFTAVSLTLLLSSGFKLILSSKTAIILLVLLIWLIVSSVLGLSFPQSFTGSYFRMQGLLSWLCYSLLFLTSAKLFENQRFRKLVGWAILAGSTLTAFLACIQFILLWFFGNTAQLLYSNRIISTFGQPNFLGAYLVMSLPFVWYLLKHSAKKQKAVIGLLMTVIILGIFVTFSRSAYLGLAVLALIFGIYHYKLLLTSLTLTIVVFALLANLFPNLVFQQWYRFQLDKVSKWTAENRLEIAQKSFQLIAQQPLTGYGLDNFMLAFPKVVNTDDLGLKDIVVDSSHNLFLDLTIQTGLIGLGLFLAVVAYSVKSGLRMIKQPDHEQRELVKTAILSAAAFLIIHQFSPVSVVPLVLFWLSLGIISGPQITEAAFSQSAKFLIKLTGITLITITILFIVQTTRADMLFHKANTYEVSNIQRAIKLDNEAIDLAPWVRFYQVRRNFLLKQLGY